MSEPEEVLIEGAHLATTYAAELWRRNRVDGRAALPALAELRGRLELYVAALRPGAPPVAVAEPPAVPHLLARLMKRVPPHLVERGAHASTDGRRIRLPRRLAEDDAAATLQLYRLLALEQAARAVRGTPVHLPPPGPVRDLYLLCEAAAVDAEIARDVPGLAGVLASERRRALAARPPPTRLTPAERAVERCVRAVLGSPPATPPEPLPLAETPADSRAWAERFAASAPVGGRYRGLPAAALWGRVHPVPPEPRAAPADVPAAPAPAPASDRTRTLERRPRVREAAEDEDDPGAGLSMVPIDDREEKAEDPMGLTRPADRDDLADPDELAESLAELDEARLVRSRERPREVLASDDPPPVRPALLPARAGGAGILYPEWDHRAGGYRSGHVTVRLAPAALAAPARAREMAARSAGLVRRVRRRFERLRPRRVRVGRRPDGPDVDLDAYVTAAADLRAGGAVEDRLYQAFLPLRRELAVCLLADVSASTDAWVSGRRRIVDVEKEALLVVCEALDALGDRYAVFAFSGEGPGDVRLFPVKAFHDPYGGAVVRRIAALEPDRYTRLGAAVRHATAALARETARHRLLLVLSDGKPNDLDEYEGRYGVEDARQAVVEARLQHVHPFCLTVDRAAPAYMPRIFGAAGFTVLRRAETLPRVLVDALRHLVSA